VNLLLSLSRGNFFATDSGTLYLHACLARLLLGQKINHDPTLIKTTIKAHVVWAVLGTTV
jgi:hypothetical protein